MDKTYKQRAFPAEVRVPYADTDQMGMVYYANYLVYFERGRTEWLRSKGMEYSSLEKEGIYLPVVEAWCRYRSPARYDDLITVHTRIADVGPCSMEFAYEITRAGKKLAEGGTKHPFVDGKMKPVKIPPSIRGLLEI